MGGNCGTPLSVLIAKLKRCLKTHSFLYSCGLSPSIEDCLKYAISAARSSRCPAWPLNKGHPIEGVSKITCPQWITGWWLSPTIVVNILLIMVNNGYYIIII